MVSPIRVSIDRQGRMVIPVRERERLGVAAGGTLSLIATPEGVFLERLRAAEGHIGADGLPVIAIKEAEPLSNEESIAAIHHERERT